MKNHYKTVWISDVHLGSAACKAEMLLNFLSSFKCDNLFLVGDIIDGWALKRRIRQVPQSHLNVIRKILSKSKNGTQVFYVIGNHDEFIRKFNDHLDLMLGNVNHRQAKDLAACKIQKVLWVIDLLERDWTDLVVDKTTWTFQRQTRQPVSIRGSQEPIKRVRIHSQSYQPTDDAKVEGRS